MFGLPPAAAGPPLQSGRFTRSARAAPSAVRLRLRMRFDGRMSLECAASSVAIAIICASFWRLVATSCTALCSAFVALS